MTKDKTKMFIVTYHDNKNKKHMVFLNQFKSIKDLENQYGQITLNKKEFSFNG